MDLSTLIANLTSDVWAFALSIWTTIFQGILNAFFFLG